MPRDLICPICGAAAGQLARCLHCGFCFQPDKLAGGRGSDPDVLNELRDLGAAVKDAQILVLQRPNDTAQGLTFLDVAQLPATSRFDLVLTGDALTRALDVNQLMAGISASLSARGLMVADVTGERFGKNSLQILLERHGFRMAPRPLKWRLSSFFRRRILARKL